MAMKNPPHPGDFIRTEIIAAAGLTVSAAAAALAVSRPALSSLLNLKLGLSGDKALRVEKAFGVHAHADAIGLRHRPDPEARRENPHSAVSLHGRHSNVEHQGAAVFFGQFRTSTSGCGLVTAGQVKWQDSQ